MKKLLMIFPLVLMFCLTLSCQKGEEAAEESAADIEIEKVKVQAILDQYIKALTTKNMELLSEIFAHDEDMVMLDGNTSQRFIGWVALRGRFQKHFNSYEKLDMTCRDQAIKIHASGAVAWLSCVFDWNFLAQGKQISTDGLRATWVLEKMDDKWKIAQLHFSFPKVDEK